MALLKSKKSEIVKTLEDIAKSAKSLVFVNFHGLNVADETALRNVLRENKVNYRVSRKSLLKRAVAGKAEGEVPELSGEVALAYSSHDELASAREIYNFGKSKGGVVKILGGIFAGKFQTAEYMTELATVPGKEVLLSKLAFLMKSPMQRLALAINEVAKKK